MQHKYNRSYTHTFLPFLIGHISLGKEDHERNYVKKKEQLNVSVTLFENEFDTLEWDTFLDFVSKQDGDEDVII